ncbi:MAG: IPT/TIG domain-containing protein [Planctomycetota bacterium]
MLRLRSLLPYGGALLAVAAGALAHERLRVNGDGAALFWPNPSNVGIVVNSDGSDNIADGSAETALRMAIQDWNDIPGSDLTLVENTDPVQQARTDWAADNIHLIWFDETNSSGFFGGGSGIVAVTPLWFFLNGQITDADILFNGQEFSFTTSQQPGHFDVGDVGAHELGHLLGLDHSGCAGATMYPYVDPTSILHRSMSLDEIAGAREIAPSTTWGRITGTVVRQSGSTPVAGAHVVALDASGRTAGAGLTDVAGAFTIFGLEAGSYSVYADPLDTPVSSANLSDGHVIETDFEATFYGSNATVPAGGVDNLGTLSVGADVALGIGSGFDVYPLRIVSGETVGHLVRGSGLVVGSTLSVSDPDITLSSVSWFGGSVSFQITVPAGEIPGHVDLAVTNPSGDYAVLSSACEVTPASPTVSTIAPTIGAAAGSTFVTVSGADFQSGARVVLGDQIYRDGVPGGCTVVDENTITLTTLATVEGTHDVVVIDSTGVEGRLVDGFDVAALPVLTSVFPPSGDADGGTEVILRGNDFTPALSVRINGVTQTNVTVDDATRVRIVTEGGVAGGPYLLEVENPGSGIASGAFVYVAQDDPQAADISPGKGKPAGGTVVTLTGVDFPADAEVVFGIDPDTGLGGTAAASVTVVDSTTLEVETPTHPKGKVSVLVRDASSGQASVLVNAFAFNSGGGGGGGCSVRPLRDRSGGSGSALGGLWMALLFGATLWMRRRTSEQGEGQEA